MLPSLNTQALCAISPSYQPVTLYGEDKSRQLKFKLPCALAWLPSFRVSPHLSLAPDWTASVLCQEAKRKACWNGKHACQTQMHPTSWRTSALSPKAGFLLQLRLLFWQFVKCLCFSPKCLCFLLRGIMTTGLSKCICRWDEIFWLAIRF